MVDRPTRPAAPTTPTTNSSPGRAARRPPATRRWKSPKAAARAASAPKLSAGSTDAQGGAYSPFTVTITREDGEQNIAALDALTLPRGLAATFAGIPHCEGAAAVTGACPPASRVGKVAAAVGAGPAPLWVPQPGKRPTAVYLGGPYKGAPTSIVAVVPKQAGPFDFGDEVVRSRRLRRPGDRPGDRQGRPLAPDPRRHPDHLPRDQRPARSPQLRPQPDLLRKEGNRRRPSPPPRGRAPPPPPPSPPPTARGLGFKPSFSLALKGGTKRGRFPALRASFRPRAGDANASSIVVRLPHSAFLEQGHFRTICTRVQYAANGGDGAVPGGLDLRPRHRQDPAPRPAARRPGLPALLQPQPARHGPLPARSSLAADPDRIGRADRLGQGRHPQLLRSDPRRPANRSPPRNGRRPEGPDRQLDQPLRLGQPGRNQARRPKRQERRP